MDGLMMLVAGFFGGLVCAAVALVFCAAFFAGQSDTRDDTYDSVSMEDLR